MVPVTADEPEEGGAESVAELDSEELVMVLWCCLVKGNLCTKGKKGVAEGNVLCAFVAGR